MQCKHSQVVITCSLPVRYVGEYIQYQMKIRYCCRNLALGSITLVIIQFYLIIFFLVAFFRTCFIRTLFFHLWHFYFILFYLTMLFYSHLILTILLYYVQCFFILFHFLPSLYLWHYFGSHNVPDLVILHSCFNFIILRYLIYFPIVLAKAHFVLLPLAYLMIS